MNLWQRRSVKMLFWDFYLIFGFLRQVSLCSTRYPGIQHVDQVSLQLTKNPPASVFWVLWLKTCVTMPGGFYFILFETGSCCVPCFSLPGAGIIGVLSFPAWDFLENSLDHHHLHMHTHKLPVIKRHFASCVCLCVWLLLL